MPRVCPICKSRALELVRTSDATGFYCKVHGHFKVADTSEFEEICAYTGKKSMGDRPNISDQEF